MDSFDPRMRQMATIDALGVALASDRAVLDSPANTQVFTYHVATGTLLAFAVEPGIVEPFSLDSAAPAIERELRALRSEETEKWDGVIVRLEKSAGTLRMQFLFDADADTVDPAATPMVEIADRIRKE
ncbi:hypothetical protein [Dietzia cercidiphylli]|uniref:hypothetical protein n=1 Tax=Dietzia cercidiphylli TaxID=498199 RepID=UPI00223B9D9F|nr:hypothetical protein [Dietzia cercidiphylli]MCT1515375.1 hypothetical protein [Dietzia cercidiphylli]